MGEYSETRGHFIGEFNECITFCTDECWNSLVKVLPLRGNIDHQGRDDIFFWFFPHYPVFYKKVSIFTP